MFKHQEVVETNQEVKWMFSDCLRGAKSFLQNRLHWISQGDNIIYNDDDDNNDYGDDNDGDDDKNDGDNNDDAGVGRRDELWLWNSKQLLVDHCSKFRLKTGFWITIIFSSFFLFFWGGGEGWGGGVNDKYLR